jgi:hypothetical protein
MKRGENCTRAHPFRPFTQPLGPAVTKPVHFFIPVSVSLHLLFDVAQKEFVVKLAHTHTQQAFPACSVLTNQQSQTILRCVPPFARYRAARSLLCRLFSINRRRTRIKSGPRVPKSVSERPYFVTDRPGSHQSLFTPACRGHSIIFRRCKKRA